MEMRSVGVELIGVGVVMLRAGGRVVVLVVRAGGFLRVDAGLAVVLRGGVVVLGVAFGRTRMELMVARESL